MPAQAEVDAFLPPYEPRQVPIRPSRSRSARWSGPEASHGGALPRACQADAALDAIPRIAAEFNERLAAIRGGWCGLPLRGMPETVVVAPARSSERCRTRSTNRAPTGLKIGGARHPVVPPVPARRGARSARVARSASWCSRRASVGRRRRVRPTRARCRARTCSGYTVVAGARRARDHPGIARAGCCARRSPTGCSADLLDLDWNIVKRQLEREARTTRRSGPDRREPAARFGVGRVEG